jgi:hypothetical protein
VRPAASAPFPAQIGSISDAKWILRLHHSFLFDCDPMLALPHGIRFLKAALLLALLLCCVEVARVGSITLS